MRRGRTINVAAVIAFLGLAGLGVAAIGMSVGSAPEMPPLSESRREMYRHYRLEFLPDSYPGRRTDKGLVPHPIYGTYVINDYLSQYERTGEARFLEAARKVGDAAISRMTGKDGALAFLYTPEMGLTSLPGTFYSGLTQSRYLTTLTRLAKATGDPTYSDAAGKVLQSLTIPIEQGGVLRRTHGGAVIEEWPRQMGDYTLNGWTTAIVLVDQFARETGSREAARLVDENLVALKALLPLYDVPQVASTRYRLSGRTWFRVRFDDTAGKVADGSISVPGEGQLPFERGTDNNWLNFIRTDEQPTQTMLNGNLNYISFPEPNSINLALDADGEGTATVEMETGDYDPKQGTPSNTRWVTVGQQSVKAGHNDFGAKINWSDADIIVYPTSHSEHIGEKYYNVYHNIHVRNLETISVAHPDPVFANYAKKWREYVERWPSMAIYQGKDMVLGRYGETPR